jgi:hypothetical protein
MRLMEPPPVLIDCPSFQLPVSKSSTCSPWPRHWMTQAGITVEQIE